MLFRMYDISMIIIIEGTMDEILRVCKMTESDTWAIRVCKLHIRECCCYRVYTRAIPANIDLYYRTSLYHQGVVLNNSRDNHLYFQASSSRE